MGELEQDPGCISFAFSSFISYSVGTRFAQELNDLHARPAVNIGHVGPLKASAAMEPPAVSLPRTIP